jgi:uncharacterized protein YciI
VKHFIVDIKFVAPLGEIDRVLAEHRAFLQIGYDKGIFLMSGPKEPREGGLIIARATSVESLQAFLKDDPYVVHGVGTHGFQEFHPVKRQPFLDEWCR